MGSDESISDVKAPNNSMRKVISLSNSPDGPFWLPKKADMDKGSRGILQREWVTRTFRSSVVASSACYESVILRTLRSSRQRGAHPGQVAATRSCPLEPVTTARTKVPVSARSPGSRVIPSISGACPRWRPNDPLPAGRRPSTSTSTSVPMRLAAARRDMARWQLAARSRLRRASLALGLPFIMAERVPS